MNSSDNTQLAPRNSGLASAADPWSQQQAALGRFDPNAGAYQQQHQPLKRLHRLLRGHYLLALTLALIGAAVGAFAGFKTQKPMYRSDGLIKIEPFTPSLQKSNDDVMPLYQAYMETQVAMLLGQRVINQAMASDEWRALGRGMDPEAQHQFVKYLEVGSLPGTFFIRVSFTDPDPSVGPVAVKAMIRAYLQIYGDVDTKDEREKLRFLESKREDLMRQSQSKEDQIMARSKEYGTQDLAELHNAKLREMVEMGSKLREAEIQLQQAETALADKEKNKNNLKDASPLTEEQIAMLDGGVMQRYFQQRDAAGENIDRLTRAGIGENNRSMITARGELDYINKKIEDWAKTFRQRYASLPIKPADPFNPSAAPTPTPLLVAQLKKNVESLRQYSEQQRKETIAIGARKLEIQQLQNDLGHIKADLDETNRLIEQHNVTLSMAGRIKVISDGDYPMSPTLDRRAQAAVLGFLGGGAFPIALLLLIGLLDQRFKYSEDTSSSADLSGVRLLGILPNLPDLQTDPRQAAVAAHCVHQIRTLLQLRADCSNGQVLAITSAGPGDGKTSLTLALGMSFAASGCRTLMIDCDLVGGALTRRLKIQTTEGVLDAMASREPAFYIQESDIENVSILPVGSAGMHHASAFSPTAIRRLVNLIREKYDVVLIDTGPVLGSIEASAVAASADSVILTIARGQQRILVERSLRHLMAVGANIAGIVFNRAETKDFERSVSRFSVRSVVTRDPGSNGNGSSNGNGNGHAKTTNPDDAPRQRRNGSGASDEFGAVVGAVVSSFKPTHGKDDDHDHA